jgi:hypothetical protein
VDQSYLCKSAQLLFYWRIMNGAEINFREAQEYRSHSGNRLFPGLRGTQKGFHNLPEVLLKI